MPNRIAAAVARMSAQIKDRIAKGLTTQEKVDALHSTLDMDIGEYCKFQEAKSLAFAQGKLTQEEAQTIYLFLGNTPSVFNEQPIAVKSVLTSLFGELLKARLSA